MSTSLTLSKRLRALSDDHLRELIAARIPSTTGLRDFFDVADALLSITSMEDALSRLPRPTLEALASDQMGEEEREFLQSNLLNDADGSATPCAELDRVLEQIPMRLGPYASVIDPSGEPASGALANAAIEKALGLVQSLDELSREIEKNPVTELARGGLAAADKARLGELLGEISSEPVAVMQLAQSADILRRSAGRWSLAAGAPAWRSLSSEGKWLSLAQAWRSSLTGAEQRALSIRLNWGPALDSWITEEYPLGHTWMDAPLDRHRHEAELLGLCLAGVVTELGREVITADWVAASNRVDALVPPYADHVYVQHDFTIIAPGPLAPAEDEFMRTLCQVESRGLASTFRLTPAGVDRLLSQGLTGDQITQRLSQLSATELPQAVAYLISDAATKFGSVRVRSHESFTTVSATDDLVLQTIASDRSLSVLGLKTRAAGELACAHPAHVVLAALSDARYPVQYEDAQGQIVPTAQWPAAPGRAVKATSSKPSLHTGAIAVADLVMRLRGTTESTGSDDATWIARQIDLAVREKGTLWVDVAMPDGSSREFLIEPKGVSNGRVRAKDRKTEVERTLPLASISSVRRG